MLQARENASGQPSVGAAARASPRLSTTEVQAASEAQLATRVCPWYAWTFTGRRELGTLALPSNPSALTPELDGPVKLAHLRPKIREKKGVGAEKSHKCLYC